MFDQIQAARTRLLGQAHQTPVMTCRTLDERVGARVYLKCENLQRVGAFKFRGAYNAISQLDADARRRGVLAYSSGNHAQAVALAAQLLGAPATIVMPCDAPAVKLAATRGYGATVVEFDPSTRTREEVAADLLGDSGLSLIKPFDNAHVIAGQGTAAAELHDEIKDLTLVLAPCGGGGLLSGTAVATKHMRPGCRVVGIEPELADDATRSFRTGTLHSVHNPPTIADGTRTSSLGELTFPLVREFVDDMQTVSEDDIMAAVRFLFYHTKLVVEPSGALPVAALLCGAVQADGRVGLILSGGNVDAQTMVRILAP